MGWDRRGPLSSRHRTLAAAHRCRDRSAASVLLCRVESISRAPIDSAPAKPFQSYRTNFMKYEESHCQRQLLPIDIPIDGNSTNGIASFPCENWYRRSSNNLICSTFFKLFPCRRPDCREKSLPEFTKIAVRSQIAPCQRIEHSPTIWCRLCAARGTGGFAQLSKILGRSRLKRGFVEEISQALPGMRARWAWADRTSETRRSGGRRMRAGT